MKYSQSSTGDIQAEFPDCSTRVTSNAAVICLETGMDGGVIFSMLEEPGGDPGAFQCVEIDAANLRAMRTVIDVFLASGKIKAGDEN